MKKGTIYFIDASLIAGGTASNGVISEIKLVPGAQFQKMTINKNGLTYYCDDGRHLVCHPYSIPNLHLMALDLCIKQCWFHKGKRGLSHYDIPERRIGEIQAKCHVVSRAEIVNIIKGILPKNKEK